MDTWQPDPRAAAEFYGDLFGWSFDEPISMSGFSGGYLLARLDGCLVAGAGQSPPQTPAGWLTHVRVEDLEGALVRAGQAGGRRPATFEAPTPAALLADSCGVMFCLRQAAGDHAFSRWVRQDQLMAVATTTAGTDIPPHWSVNFAVPSADRITVRATELGGGVVMAPSEAAGFRSAVIRDPWGGVVTVSA